MSSLKNKKLERMSFGFEYVQIAKNSEFDECFKSHIKNIPMYIHVNGLIPTCAFIMAKIKRTKDGVKTTSLDTKSYLHIADMIVKYFKKFELVNSELQYSLESLIEELFSLSMSEYRQYTLEVLSMLKWAVKFSDGMIVNKDSASGDENEG